MSIKEEIRTHCAVLNGVKRRIGIGCAWLGRSGDYRNTLDADLETLNTAYRAGFRYFDTSRAYGESECTVGRFIEGIDRSTIFLATKARFTRSDRNAAGAARFKQNFEESFDRLHTGMIDLFQIHELDDPGITGDIVAFLREQREGKRIRYIGVGTYSMEVHSGAVSAGYADSSLTYGQYNPLLISARDLIEQAANAGTGLVNASPLASGYLTGGNPLEIPSRNYPFLERRQELAVQFCEICDNYHVPVLAAALQFPERNGKIDITLTGPSSAGEVRSTIAALNHDIVPEFWDEVSRWHAGQPDIGEEPDRSRRSE